MPSSPSSPSRGPVTNRVILELRSEGHPVGDNAAPEDPYGWQGEPNGSDSHFIPWMSLTPGPGSSLTPPGAMGDTGQMWRFVYNIFYAGVSRKQCEALADKMREALTNIAREVVETKTGPWKIMKISCTNIGNVNRVGSTFPDYSTQADSFEVWITKG